MLGEILSKLAPFNARLVAVSKTQPVEEIRRLYDLGQRVFGENRVQELAEKQPLLPSDIDWHLIGHLQTNKARQAVALASLIHSVDSFKLLQAIDNEAVKLGKKIDCLFQFHIAAEESKFGFEEKEAFEMLHSPEFSALKNTRIRGVMGMATFTEDRGQVHREFRRLKEIFERLKTEFFADRPEFNEISMGMSGDYDIALEEGATMVRIGSLLFGRRT